ncbi:43kDa postsynaptic protein [Parasponia andersonii]|uniref:RING-type E3 ubiquitin transferase n=1 Tax=Parasponia andersonii TaxID=3476 RepID=A0A2P5E3M9_PARAD|nr:43kDa postsynaptic protein [Parasponia andersonii]
MAAFASSSSSSVSPENPMAFIAASSSSPLPSPSDDNLEEDSCSICLEPFNSDDPSTITSCRHEYHLHCILEWSQRSKECPICWQLLALKDPASQELLAAVEKERLSRSRKTSSVASSTIYYSRVDDDEGEDSDHETLSNEFVFDEHIMQHLAAAASRARLRGRERHRYSGLDPSQVFYYSSPANSEEHTHTMSADDSQNSSYGSSVGDSPPTVTQPALNAQPSPPVVPSTDVNSGVPLKPRVLYSQLPSVCPQRPSPSEMSTLSDSFKSKWSAASARYKESLSKGTRGLKEKLRARNASVKELSKGVQREMSAGIAGVARMIERFDLTPKRAGVSTSDSDCDGVAASNLSTKGKGVLENSIVQSLCKNSGKVADEVSSDAAPHPCIVIPGRVEVSRSQSSEQ